MRAVWSIRELFGVSLILGLGFGLSACGGGTTIGSDQDEFFAQANPFAPIIKLEGENPQKVEVFTEYEELGATATSLEEGDLSSKIEAFVQVDTTELGDYLVTYIVEDSVGRIGRQSRRIQVRDTTAPQFQISGQNIVERTFSFDPAAGVVATDNYDENVDYELEGSVDVSDVGVYTLTYSATDSSGNTRSKTREVSVEDTIGPDAIVVSWLTASPSSSLSAQFRVEEADGSEDVEAVEYKILPVGETCNSTSFNDGASTISLDSSELTVDVANLVSGNSYRVCARGQDAYGNFQTAASVSPTALAVDTEAPIVQILTPLNGFFANAEPGQPLYYEAVDFNGVCSEVGRDVDLRIRRLNAGGDPYGAAIQATTECENDSDSDMGSWEITNVDLSSFANDSENQDVQVIAYHSDNASNVSESTPVNGVIDIISPVVEFESPENSSSYNTALISVRGSCEADQEVLISGLPDGIDNPTCGSAGSFDLGPVDFSSLVTDNQSTELELTARQTDEAGNDSALEETSFTIDLEAPEVSIDVPTEGEVLSSSLVHLEGVCSEEGQDVRLVGVPGGDVFTSCNPNSSPNWEADVDFGVAEDEVLDVSITAFHEDAAGNVGESEPRNFTIDRESPEVSILEPTSFVVAPGSSTVDFNGLCSEIGIEVQLSYRDEGLSSSCADTQSDGVGRWSESIEFADELSNPGSIELTASQTDLAGNTGSDSATGEVVDGGLSIMGSAEALDGINSDEAENGVAFSGSCLFNGQMVQIEGANPGTQAPCEDQSWTHSNIRFDSPSLQDGSLEIIATQGEISSSNLSLTLDRRQPVLTYSYAGDSAQQGDGEYSFTLCSYDEEDPAVTAMDNGQDISDDIESAGEVLALAAGVYILSYSVEDAVGNSSSLQIQVSIDGDLGEDEVFNYGLTNKSELEAVDQDLQANYALCNDIDLESQDFDPIASEEDSLEFEGLLDGRGFTISNLYLTAPSTDDDGTALVSALGTEGVIRNLNLSNVDVATGDIAGALVGRNKGLIKNAHVFGGQVFGYRGNFQDKIGGLVGINEGSIRRSGTNVEVLDGETAVGGLVGQNQGEIADSYARSKVDGGFGVGGLVGLNEGSGTVDRSYATGEGGITGIGLSGGLIGENSASSGSVSGSVWSDLSGLSIPADQQPARYGLGLEDSRLQMLSTYGDEFPFTDYPVYQMNWDINLPGSIWNIDDGVSYPYHLN